MVVAGDDEHAAPGGSAVGVAVAQGVAGAVHAGSLAVPEGPNAINRALGVGLDLLRAEHGGGGQVLVDPGLEADVGGAELVGRAPHLLVHCAERGAPVAGHEARGVEARGAVPLGLEERGAHQGLRARQVDARGRTRFGSDWPFQRVDCVHRVLREDERGRGCGEYPA